jgi:hypothetical protein
VSTPVDLLVEERTNGRERLCVRWLPGDRGGRLDIAIEKREGDGWGRVYGMAFAPNEALRLHDALGMACWCVHRGPR